MTCEVIAPRGPPGFCACSSCFGTGGRFPPSLLCLFCKSSKTPPFTCPPPRFLRHQDLARGPAASLQSSLGRGLSVAGFWPGGSGPRGAAASWRESPSHACFPSSGALTARRPAGHGSKVCRAAPAPCAAFGHRQGPGVFGARRRSEVFLRAKPARSPGCKKATLLLSPPFPSPVFSPPRLSPRWLPALRQKNRMEKTQQLG